MPTPNVPTDLIQEVVDILAGDNNHARIITQGTHRNSGVLVMYGDVYALDGENFLKLRNLRIEGAMGVSPEFTIHLSEVIEIRPVAAEEE